MAFLKRVSDGFWSFVSPQKEGATTPQTVPKFKKSAIPLRKASLEDVITRGRSMSPIARVDSWRIGSEGGRKRKYSYTSSIDAESRKQGRMMDDEEMGMRHESDLEYDEDVSMDDEGVEDGLTNGM